MTYFIGATIQQALDKALADGWQDEFEGMNCNDYLEDDQPYCGGWDGKSRRCECGNRRVYWHCEQQDDKEWWCWAEAY